MRVLAISTVLLAAACIGGTTPPASPSSTRVIGLSGDLAFGSVNLGSSSARTFTVSNSGNTPLTLTGVSTSGGTGAKDVVITPQAGLVPASGALQVTVQFSPTLAQPYSSTIVVAGDQTAGTNTITFSGTGVAVMAPSVTFGADPTTIVTGGHSTLTWTSSGSNSVSLDHGIGLVSPNGTLTVSPTVQATTYHLTATSASGGSVSAAVRVNVSDSMFCAVDEVPAGSTALCLDGSSSQSQSRAGTCSLHGGVSCWVCPGPLCSP